MIERTLRYGDAAHDIEGRILITYKDDPDTDLAEENDIIVSYFEDENVGEGWWVTFVGKNGERNDWGAPSDTPGQALEALRAAGLDVFE